MATSAPSPAIRTATATPPTAARQAGSFSVEDGQRRERSAIRVATDVGDREVYEYRLGRVSEAGWDQLDVMPDGEIEAIRKVLGTRLPILPYPYLRDGQRVRITRGPLADVEGIFVRGNPNKGLLVLSVDLLHRSVAVQIDCTLVEAA